MTISELVGVYDADGGLRGEAAYVWGKLRTIVATTGAPVVRGREGPRWRELVGAAETVLRRHLEAPA